MKTLLFAVALLLAAPAVCPTAAKCPIDDSQGVYFKDEWPNGKHLKFFRCPSGHVYSVVC